MKKYGVLTPPRSVATALIHVTPIPGCETHNMRFFEERGMCAAVSSPQDQPLAARDRLMDEAERQRMHGNQRRLIPSHASASIRDLIEREYEKGYPPVQRLPGHEKNSAAP